MISGLDMLIILAFIVYAIASGLGAKEQASQNLEEYFLAGRSLPGWKAGISMAATQFAADTPLLVTGLIATQGIFSLWRLWIYAVAFLLMAYLLAPCWRRSGMLTDAELAEFRYGGSSALGLRVFKAIYFGTIFNCTVLAMVFLAATRIAEPFLLWNQWLPPGVYAPVFDFIQWSGLTLTTHGGPDALLLTTNNLISLLGILGLTLFYSTAGGLRSVVETDVAQFAMMIIATVIFVVYVIVDIGGLSAIPDRLQQLWASGVLPIPPDELLSFTPYQAHDVSLPIIFMIGLQWLIQMNSDGTGYLAQRTMACRSDEDARQAAVTFTVTQVLVRSLLWLPLGIGLLILFPPTQGLSGAELVSDREFTYVRGMAELLPSGVKGLLLTGMLAALASTVDTHLNWGASYWTKDIYERLICMHWLKRKPSPRSLVHVARLANILILLLAILVVPFLSSIQKAWQLSLMLGSGVGIMLILRWLWWRVTAQGELAAIVGSAVFSLMALNFLESDQEALRLLVVASGSTLLGISVSLLTTPRDLSALVQFYKRVQPPGFWGPVARAAQVQHSTAAMQMSLLRTLISSFSIFCLLVGIGAVLVGSRTPFGNEQRWLWILLCIGTGLVLSPAWFKPLWKK